jgi:uncharacterized protein YdeI (BOF family)
MALIPLNTFKTKTKLLTGYSATTATITSYVAPIGVTSIILMAQVSNLTTETQYVNFIHYRKRPVLSDAQGNGYQAPNTETYMVKDFAIPAGDAGTVLSGKLIIESLDSVRAYTSNSGTCHLTLSILETANN